MGLLCIGPPSWASLHVNSPPRSGFCGSVQSPDLKIALAQWGKWDLVRHDLLQAQDRHCAKQKGMRAPPWHTMKVILTYWLLELSSLEFPEKSLRAMLTSCTSQVWHELSLETVLCVLGFQVVHCTVISSDIVDTVPVSEEQQWSHSSRVRWIRCCRYQMSFAFQNKEILLGLQDPWTALPCVVFWVSFVPGSSTSSFIKRNRAHVFAL